MIRAATVVTLSLLSFAPAGSGLARAEVPVQAVENPADVRTLLKRFAAMPGLEGEFREEKKLALLKAPLVSHGHIYQMPPGYLLRKVEGPNPSSVRITPHELLISDKSGEQHVDLRARPAIKLFVESFTRVLAGDLPALQRIYQIQFTPAPNASGEWELKLLPKADSLAQLIRSLTLSGKGYSVERVSVFEANGDVTETYLSNINPRRTFSARERQELFGIAPQAP